MPFLRNSAPADSYNKLGREREGDEKEKVFLRKKKLGRRKSEESVQKWGIVSIFPLSVTNRREELEASHAIRKGKKSPLQVSTPQMAVKGVLERWGRPRLGRKPRKRTDSPQDEGELSRLAQGNNECTRSWTHSNLELEKSNRPAVRSRLNSCNNTRKLNAKRATPLPICSPSRCSQC